MSDPHVPSNRPPQTRPELPPMGWYPDPTGTPEERYWDGQRWTHNTREPQDQPDWVSGLGSKRDPQHAAHDGHQAARQATEPPAPVPMENQWDHTTATWRPLPVVVPKQTTDGVRLAGFGRRAVGQLIDYAILVALSVLVCWPQYSTLVTEWRTWWATVSAAMARGVTPDATAFVEATSGPIWVITLTLTCLLVVTQAFFHHRAGATPGQMVMGMRVVPVDQGKHGHQLPLGLAIRRATSHGAFFALSQMIIFPIVVDYVAAAISLKGQTLHDRLSGTQVVRVQPTPSTPAGQRANGT